MRTRSFTWHQWVSTTCRRLTTYFFPTKARMSDRWAFVKLCSQKMIYEPQTGIEPATFWWPVRGFSHWATKSALAHHLSLGSSMVRASHRSSERCRFDSCLGLRNHFLRIVLDERSSIIEDISKLPHFQNIYLKNKNWIRKLLLLPYLNWIVTWVIKVIPGKTLELYCTAVRHHWLVNVSIATEQSDIHCTSSFNQHIWPKVNFYN